MIHNRDEVRKDIKKTSTENKRINYDTNNLKESCFKEALGVIVFVSFLLKNNVFSSFDDARNSNVHFPHRSQWFNST